MSGFGTTQFYVESTVESPEAGLVVGKYPMALVRELTTQNPGGLLGSFIKTRLPTYDESGNVLGDDHGNENNGTNDVDDEQMSGKQISSTMLPNTILPFCTTGAIYLNGHLKLPAVQYVDWLMCWRYTLC